MLRQEPSAYGIAGASARLIYPGVAGTVGYRNGFGIVAITAGLDMAGAAISWILEIQPFCSPGADWLPQCQIESTGALPAGIDVRTRWVSGLGPNGGKRVEVYMLNGAASATAGFPAYGELFGLAPPAGGISPGDPIQFLSTRQLVGGFTAVAELADGSTGTQQNTLIVPRAGKYKITVTLPVSTIGQIALASMPDPGTDPPAGFATVIGTIMGVQPGTTTTIDTTTANIGEIVLTCIVDLDALDHIQIENVGAGPLTIADGTPNVFDYVFRAELMPPAESSAPPFPVENFGEGDAVLFHLEQPGADHENSPAPTPP